MLSRTIGHSGSSSRRVVFRALIAAALTCITLPWLMSRIFVTAILMPPCLPAPLPPPVFEAVEILTRDGLRLGALWHPPKNGAVILLMGGIGSNSSAMLQEAGWLAESGFGILSIESRSCQARSLTLGFHESEDYLAMLDYARQQSNAGWIGVFGFSSGAAAAIRAAAQTEGIDAVVAEGGYASLTDLLLPGESPFFSVEGQLQRMNFVTFWQKLRFWPGLINPLADLERVSPRPVLLIFGETEMNRAQAGQMLNAAGENAALWIIPEVGHGQYAANDPQLYRQRLVEFFSASFYGEP